MFAARIRLVPAVALLLVASPASAEVILSVDFSVTRLRGVGTGSQAMLQLELPLSEPSVPSGTLAQPTGGRPRPATRRSGLSAEFVRRVVRAAHRAAGRGRVQQRLDSLASRSRSSAALPELSLRAERSTDESLRLAPTLDDPYRYTQAGGVRTTFGGKLTWRLNRLLFAPDELVIERLRIERARADARRVDIVLRHLFAWQRARVRARSAELSEEEQEQAALDAMEAEAVLDVLTDGWFSRASARL
ncbi:MAG: hypothetical protein R3B13_25800 [Polyangiaceae bacterium]